MNYTKLFLNLFFTFSILAGTGGLSGGSKPGKGKLGIDENSSWDRVQDVVKKNFNLKVSGDTVFVGRPLSAFDTCIDGENFVSTKKFPIYKQVRVSRHQDNDGDKDGWTNVKVGEEYLSFPITYTSYKDVCNNRDKNCKRVTYTVDQEIIKNIKINFLEKSTSNKNKDSALIHEIFEKEYIIPYCD